MWENPTWISILWTHDSKHPEILPALTITTASFHLNEGDLRASFTHFHLPAMDSKSRSFITDYTQTSSAFKHWLQRMVNTTSTCISLLQVKVTLGGRWAAWWRAVLSVCFPTLPHTIREHLVRLARVCRNLLADVHRHPGHATLGHARV